MHHAPVVIHAADPGLVFHVALVLAVDVLLDILDHRIVGACHVETGGDIALGGGARGNRVLLGAGPPHADDLLPREAHLGRRLERRRVHHAPAAQDHPVGLDLAHLQPLGLLLVARMGDRDVGHLEAVLLRLGVQHRDGLLAVSRVVIDVHDLLALELVHPAFLHADELDLGGVLGPVVGDQREHPGEDAPVAGVGAAVADGHDGNLVLGRLVEDRVGDAGGQGLEHRVAGLALFLQALIALHAAGVVVLGLAFLPHQLDAVDAAVALVDQGHVIDPAAVDAGAARRVGANPVARQADELLAGGVAVQGTESAGQRQADQSCLA